MKKLTILMFGVVCPLSSVFCLPVLGLLSSVVGHPSSVFKTFITLSGDKLMDESGEFRFISFNVPCLHYSEDNVPFTQTNPWRLSDEFEITDALESVRQAGGTVVRIYTLSVRRPGEDPNIPRHIIGPGQFDEKPFKSLDMVLAVANRKGIRIIFPFIDNWKWWGGIGACAAFRGKEPNDFWTDPLLFEDYKKIVSFVINRTNTITGVQYRDDKAILAWETGNELLCPPEWTAKAAAYIKSIDKNHLVIDGFHTMTLREQSIEDKNIDIVTTHFYPLIAGMSISTSYMIDRISHNASMARGKKAYFVGEFGFIPTRDAESLLQTVINEKISGALIWSLRFHNRDGGFYSHSEPYGGDKYKAYHWPGFASGNAYDETGILNLMRQKAFEIRGKTASPAGLRMSLSGELAGGELVEPIEGALPIEKPQAPLLLDIKDVAEISWQGSAGAQSYTVERAENKDGPGSTLRQSSVQASSPPRGESRGWIIVGSDISDADVQYRPLFNDTTAEIGPPRPTRAWRVEAGKSYYYRVIAKNSAGPSEPSNVVGPVSVSCKTLVDEMQDWKFINKHSGKLSLETKEARKFKEDSHRLKGAKGDYIVYQVDSPINSVKVYSFYPDKISDFIFHISEDGNSFEPAKGRGLDVGSADGGPAKFSRHDYFSGKGDYNYYPPVLYESQAIPANARFLKIEFNAEAQISRVEIKYGR
jgi:hypothetical protein